MRLISLSLLMAVCLSFPFLGSAQVLRGTVLDKDSYLPVPNADLQFKLDEKTIYTAKSGPDGRYQFDELRPGIGQLSVSAPGYAPYRLAEIAVAAGKERVLHPMLSPGALEAELTSVEVLEARPLRQVAPLGEIPLAREQNLYYPMTYYDPARLAMSFAGVAQVDDGTNFMSIRGNNPTFLRWRLNGLDIVNPNHLPNAGTFSDRPTVSSGGVLMLSAQMIDNSALITGAGTVGYNDGIAGIMDLQLRKGNDRRHEQTIQAGLIGMDISAEGPLGKRRRGASYLLNYRYSTVGILGRLGVSFGGEKINFQDIAAHFHLPGRGRNYWSVFALGGQSENIFSKPDSALVFKDLFNIDFRSNTGVVGLTMNGFSGNNYSYKVGVTISWQGNTRLQTADTLYASDRQEQNRFSLHYSNRYLSSKRMHWLFGANMTLSSISLFDNTEQRAAQIVEGNFALQGWIANEYTFGDGKFKTHVGFNPLLSPYGASLDPRVQFYWRIAPQHQLVFSVANYSQTGPLWLSSWADRLMQASISAIRYNWTPFPNWIFSAEAFSQGISGLAVNRDQKDGIGWVNETEPLLDLRATNEGTARNVGLELTAARRLQNGWFLNANMTFLDSKYRGSDGVERDTRWDVGQIANVTAGKEWRRKPKKEGKVRVFGLNGRAVLTGGTRAMPIDAMRSANEQRTVFIYTNGYTLRNAPYFRLDGRIYWKKSLLNRRNSTFALEFQNLTLRDNIAYQYYDPFTRQVETKYQLGLIPNLSWRLEF